MERLETFAEMEQEAAHETSEAVQSQLQGRAAGRAGGAGEGWEWPQEGDVLLKEVSFRYRPNLPLVLNKLNVHILPREKVGIVVSICFAFEKYILLVCV